MCYKLSADGIKPLNSKIQGITEKLRPKNLRQLRSYLGAINQMNKFVPNLAILCAPFRTILKHNAEWNWEPHHEEAFKRINEKIGEITELTHFKRALPLRIICDASKDGLGAVLQQFEDAAWKPISFASRFLD